MTDDRFRAAMERVLRWEGDAYTDDPADRGGSTRWGVTISTLSTYRGAQCTPGDVRNLTKDEAVEVYRRLYWAPNGYDRLREPVDEHVFDFAVNAGPSTAHRALQRALRAVGRQVVDDGVLGPKTIEAANAAEPKPLLAAFRMAREMHYRLVVAVHPEQVRFLVGWLNRAYAA